MDRIYLTYPYVEMLAGIKAVWALALEIYEAARVRSQAYAGRISHRDFSPIRPAGNCSYRRSGRARARAGLPGKKDRNRGGDEVA